MREGYSFIYSKEEIPLNTWQERVRWIRKNNIAASYNLWAKHNFLWFCFSNFDDATMYKLTWEGK